MVYTNAGVMHSDAAMQIHDLIRKGDGCGHIHAYIHTYIHAYLHTYLYTYMHTFYTADAQEHRKNAYVLYRRCAGTR